MAARPAEDEYVEVSDDDAVVGPPEEEGRLEGTLQRKPSNLSTVR
jgi:hypothetical protein